MFKLVACLCFVLIFVSLASSSAREDAKKLIRQLKSQVNPKSKYFDENIVKWKNEVYDAVKVFDVKARKDLDEELKRLYGIFDDLKKKNKKCVANQKSKIAALSSVGGEFSSCSSHIESSTARHAEELMTRFLILKGRRETLDVRFKDCKNIEPCFEFLIPMIKKELEELPSDMDEKIMFTKDLFKDKKNDLKKCSTISKLTSAGDKIIKNINACAA